MFNTTRIGARMTFSAVLLAFTQSALALGLGNISVESYLNQPLQAKIELISGADEDLSSVTVGMASADDFALIGASRDAISVPLSFELEQHDGAADILVTSKLPLTDPVLRLIVEVNWANGRLLREYTLFLDPPSFDSQAPPPVVDERGKPPISPPPATAEWVQPDKEKAAERTSTPPKPAAATRSDTYGPVPSGDTLWHIAARWSEGTGLDMNAVMVAIQRNNPQAFIKNNINLLMQGAILRMPEVDEVRQISAETARREVQEQNRATSQPAAALAVETPLLDANSQQPSAEEASPGGKTAEDKLELVPPADKSAAPGAGGSKEALTGSSTPAEIQAARDELARKEEELAGEQQQNRYLKDQVAELRKRLESAESGNVENAGLSQMEAQLRKDRLAKEGAEKGETDTDQTPAVVPKPAAPKVTAAAKTKPEEPWYSGWTIWLLVLLVLGAAVAGWLLNRRKSGLQGELEEISARKDETVREIKDEAEEILKTLKPDREKVPDKGTAEAAGEIEPETAKEEPPPKTAEKEPSPKSRARREQPSEEAKLLDEDSADPEVRLDLARAYISMGDREAARVILDEVMEHGSDEQQAEARKMLDEL